MTEAEEKTKKEPRPRHLVAFLKFEEMVEQAEGKPFKKFLEECNDHA